MASERLSNQIPEDLVRRRRFTDTSKIITGSLMTGFGTMIFAPGVAEGSRTATIVGLVPLVTGFIINAKVGIRSDRARRTLQNLTNR